MKYRKILIIAIPVLLLLGALSYNFWFAKSASRGSSGQLVGYWTMDTNDMSPTGATMYDKSGFNNTGTVTGTATSTGRINQARNFNGTSDYVDVGTGLDQSGNLTVSAWIKTNTLATSPRTIVGNVNSLGNTLDYLLEINRTACKITGLRSAAAISVTGNTCLSADTWYHVVYVISGSVGNWTNTLYLNGVQDGSSVDANNPSGTNETTSIGRAGAYNSGYFSGSIDDVRVYNYALSAQEVANLYSSAKINYVQAPSRTASSTNTSSVRGLVGYWTMDTNDMSPTGATMYDKSGFNNTGTVTGTATSTGRIGQARSFNGTSDYVAISDKSYFSPVNNQMTITGWFKTSATGRSSIIAKSASITYEWAILVNDNSRENKLTFVLWDASGAEYGAAVSAVNVNDEKWHFFVATVNYGVRADIYVDGVLSGSDTTFVNSMSDLAANVDIGRRPDNALYLNGSIDDVRIYNYALSAQEVANLYSSAKVNYISAPPRTGLVGYWTMDTNDMSPTGATMYDKSGFNNTGTVTGTATSTGRIGQARSFNGTSDNISLGDYAPFENASALSFGLWFNATDIPSGTNRMLINKNAQVRLTMSSANYLTCQVGYGPDWVGTPTGVPLSSLTAGVWYHAFCTFNGTATSFYLNGEFQNSDTDAAFNTGDTANIVRIGSYDDSLFMFKGSLDDIRIYNRALSAAEVAQLYSSAKINYVK